MSEDLEKLDGKRLELALKRAENDSIRLHRGYLRGTLVPALTGVGMVIAMAYGIRLLCTPGTLFDPKMDPYVRSPYYNAQLDYLSGELEPAARRTSEILIKLPSHPAANQLMARIELARGNRAAAIKHIRKALETSDDQEKLTRWLAALEAKP